MSGFRKLRKEFENELTDNILNYWVKKVYDPQRRTFIGYIRPDEKADFEVPLEIVMISRILWTFSAAWQYIPTVIYKKMADEAWRILTESFWHHENGEWHWLIAPDYQVKSVPKVSPWKCPYHNSRICLEMIRRLNEG